MVIRMSDSGYSRLEKDFLGNERMVHYDGSGNMLGASDVIREPDGTIRISNEQVSASDSDDLPKVEALVPPLKVKSVDEVRGVRLEAKSGMQSNQVVMYAIAAFVGTSLVTLAVLSFLKSNRSSDPSFGVPQNYTQQIVPPRVETRPGQENFPSDPKPRNDEPPTENRPFDQTAPDSNMDDKHPKIRNDSAPAAGSDPKPDVKPEKSSSSEPIDLRGDDGSKKDIPKSTGPGTDPLKGNDIH